MLRTLWDALTRAGSRRWTGIYLRVLAVVYGLGGLVHIGNVLGFGDVPWAESPIAWRVGDIVYGILDVIAAGGLWRRAAWGLVAFFVAAGSQLVLYIGFPEVFAFTADQRSALQGLVVTHVVTLLAFVALWIARK